VVDTVEAEGLDTPGDVETDVETWETSDVETDTPDTFAEAVDAPVDTVDAPDMGDVTQCPGGPGCACSTDQECDQGPCIEDQDGVKRCAAPCHEGTCQDGYQCEDVNGEPFCVWSFSGLCRPCTEDADCAAYEGDDRMTCQDMEAGRFCTRACDQGQCPEGYECKALDRGDGYCVPESGHCECTDAAVTDQAQGTCFNTNQWGACEGTWACGSDGLSACDAREPAQETCNGVDDDCDGVTDEDTEDCTDYYKDSDEDGWGTDEKQCLCQAWAPYTATKSGDCDDTNPGVNPGANEACNGLDDDCDNDTDEDVTPPAGLACSEQGVCAGQGVAPQCKDGDWVCDYSQVPGYQAFDDNCDCQDNDCDGAVDEEKACALYFPDLDGDRIIDACDDDIDGDGVVNADDDCPYLYDPNQDGPCQDDADGDGVTDDADNCVNTPNPDQLDGDNDGQGDACDQDLDNDGYDNAVDCNPLDPKVNPGADEVCDGVDNDCDHQVDEGCESGVHIVTVSALVETEGFTALIGQSCVTGRTENDTTVVEFGFLPITR
jgi:hypothetical protein